MNFCIGILAYNEEKHIAATLEGLRHQDLWTRPEHNGRLLLVVNGTTDRTADIARHALHSFPVPSRVHELHPPGKANAWNHFVHDFSPADADVLLLLDADILLPRPDALRLLLETLAAHPQAVAAVDEPLKITPGTPRARARLTQSASALAAAGPPKLCGQLYAARATALRRIYLPEPLLVEDGFIKAMLTTDAFHTDENPERLVRAPGVWHEYEAETTLRAWIRHEKRILLGTLCNLVLYEQSRQWVQQGLDPARELRRQQQADPDAFRKRLRRDLAPGGSHRRLGILLPVPWRQLRRLRGTARLKALPAALIRTALTLLVIAAAARDLRKDRLAW